MILWLYSKKLSTIKWINNNNDNDDNNNQAVTFPDSSDIETVATMITKSALIIDFNFLAF